MADRPDDLQLLAVLMMDVRATVDSMRRSITNTQSSIEQFRHTRSKELIDDVQDCLKQLTDECRVITETVAEANKPLKNLATLADRSTTDLSLARTPIEANRHADASVWW